MVWLFCSTIEASCWLIALLLAAMLAIGIELSGGACGGVGGVGGGAVAATSSLVGTALDFLRTLAPRTAIRFRSCSETVCLATDTIPQLFNDASSLVVLAK